MNKKKKNFIFEIANYISTILLKKLILYKKAIITYIFMFLCLLNNSLIILFRTIHL
jgi:hypothetical protein